MGFAGLWETWTGAAGDTIRTYAILTCDVDPALAFIHNRMPVILDAKDFGMWLSDTPDQAIGLAIPTMRDLHAHPISQAVNSPKNNGPELLMPLQ